jgi:hypothetical protein
VTSFGREGSDKNTIPATRALESKALLSETPKYTLYLQNKQELARKWKASITLPF